MPFYMALSLIKINPNIGIKLPEWEGFWIWRTKESMETYDDCMFVCLKNGKIIEIRDTEELSFTLENICREDWVEVKLDNISIKEIMKIPQLWSYKKSR